MTALTVRLRATAAGEWTKLWSVRSVPAMLLAIAPIMLLGSWFATAGYHADWGQLSASERASFDPTYTSIQGIELAQLLVGALGVLTITGEYATGLIRTTFTATPQRVQVVAVKAAIFGSVVWTLCTALSFAAFVIGQRQLTSPVPHASLDAGSVVRAVLGGGVYLLLVGLFGLALGAILRGTASALSALFGLLLVAPLVFQMFPSSLSARIGAYLPSNAGEDFWHVVKPDADALGPWQGLAVFTLYVAVAGAAGSVLLRKRDV
jgi:ABC-2 type transport system permease protein